MWISWSITDPIMDQLHLIYSASSKEDYIQPIVEYSTMSGEAWGAYERTKLRVDVTTHGQFQKAVLLAKLGMSVNEIQQHIDLGTTDDT